MEKFDIFQDIAERTGGDIYVGVVGPVRTGKSTFIKKFMELLVLPNISDPHDREWARDSLPQSGEGLDVMTTEPKFIPDDGVEVVLRDNVVLKVRLVDCVGYTIEGALGYAENEGHQMVRTPWFEEKIPFQEAAEIGTRKVMEEHSTIGLIVTTDGTITELPRENYRDAEKCVVWELKKIGKPFVMVLNSRLPHEPETVQLAAELEEEYDVPVVPVDCLQMDQNDIQLVFEQVLYEFPVKEVSVELPDWVEELHTQHWLRERLETAVNTSVREVKRVRDVEKVVEQLGSYDFTERVGLSRLNLGLGLATIQLIAKESLFYGVLEELTGYPIEGKSDIIRNIGEMAAVKKEFERVGDALSDVRDKGYGLVAPNIDDMIFEEPELMRQGNRFGIKLRARAPSFHFLRADIETEITPLVGSEKQCEELVTYLLEQFEDNPGKIWQSNIFGKPLSELVQEGIQNKLHRMPDNVQIKLQETLERIVNDGSGGLICIIV